MKLVVALVLAWWLGASRAAAPPAPLDTPQSWPIDAAHSQVRFSVRKFWITRARGTFPALSGTLRAVDVGAEAPQVQVAATLAVANLHMHAADDQARALGPDFFAARRYPLIEFDSAPFGRAELATGGPLRGQLTLHGVQRTVTLALQPSACPAAPLDCPIRVRGAISRSAFGMHGFRGVLSDRVELDLRIVLDAATAAVPPASLPSPGQ